MRANASRWARGVAACVLAIGLAGRAPHAAAADAFTDGFAYHQQNKFHDARRLYTEATRGPDADADVWYHLGLVESLLDNPRDAARAFHTALELEPQSPYAYRFRTNLGWALIEAKDLQRGVAELIVVAGERDEDFNALANVGHALYMFAHDYNRAEEWYQRLATRFPQRQGEQPVAELWLREAKQRATILKIGTGFDVFRGQVIGGTFRGTDYGPSPSDASIVFRTVDGEDVHIRKSEIRTVSSEPKYRGMGLTMGRGQGERELHRYDAIFPEENLRVGHALLKRGDAQGAARQFRAALRKDPDSADAPFALAVAHYRQGQYAEAVHLLEDCVDLPKVGTQARYYLVSAYANHLGDMNAALEHALAYVQIPDAEHTSTIDSAAVAIVRRLVTDHEGVPETQWTAAANLNLDQADHRRILGLAYLHEKQPGPALRHLGAAAEMGTGLENTRALRALELCLAQLDAQGQRSPTVEYYRGYLSFARGRLDEAEQALQKSAGDSRTQTLLALVKAYQQDTDGAQAALDAIDAHALPPATRRLYDVASAVLDAPTWYDRTVAEAKKDEFGYSRVGAVNGLGVYSDTGEGDLMPIIAVCKKNGRGGLEVNGNPMFDLFSVISFKEAFDWVENSVDPSFPNQWDTTITFGGLSLYLGKGGDSAGCAIALALCSAVTGQAALQDVAVTGAIRLDGRVEPVGAVPEKVDGAVAKGIRTIILPTQNLADLDVLDADAFSRVKFVSVASVADARRHTFGPGDPKTAEEFTGLERRFRTGCRYYQLGAYTLARRELEAVHDAWPEVLSARRLLDAMDDAVIGPVQPDALGG